MHKSPLAEIPGSGIFSKGAHAQPSAWCSTLLLCCQRYLIPDLGIFE
ncbi:hypothetical protein HMPREF9104_01392 [Lentilactobacillus kisonensis F0435]|uniref:Uncharacterized protein n=1 Tax=Lentilactobacillus kisonensis F0435 TaxID=797516 RepID=H1LFL6_9LACO|nr:hypothetical protein HMPREF9104_01392 [Lentilactobacillus kisonensis F0435]